MWGCCKQIYTHHKVLICFSCNKISHYNCCKSLYTYNQVNDQWFCNSCDVNIDNYYNPFSSICSNQCLDNEPEAYQEISNVSELLKNCKITNKKDLNQKFFGFDKLPLSILFNNIDGFSENFDMFSAELLSLKNRFDLLAIAETNIDETHKNLYNILGYESFFNSKIPGKHKGSGLGIYMNENFTGNKLNDLCICTKDIETLFIEISCFEQPFNFGVVYRPPNGNIENFYTQLEHMFGKITGNTIISGDFNINLFNHDNIKSKFENIIFGNCFVPIISCETHVKPGCKPSCIDNILVLNINQVMGSKVCHELKVSHHYPIMCFYDISVDIMTTENNKIIPRYDYCESNIAQFNIKLDEKLSKAQYTVDENGFNDFIQCIHETVDECCKVDPEKFAKSKRNRLINPWITNGLINSINKKNFLYESWTKSKNKKDKLGDQNIYLKYRDYRQKLKFLIRCAKKRFYYEKFKGDSKKLGH